jgi:hypothetical protein
MKYSISFYCYKLEENELSISISKKNDIYLLTETYITYSLDTSFPAYTKEVSFIYYIPMLHYLMNIFDEFYKENVTTNYTFEEMPPAYYITDICGLSIDRYVEMVNSAKIKMENAIFLYNNIIEDIKSKLNKAAFRLLTIKIEKEKIKSLHTLCITGDLIVQFL